MASNIEANQCTSQPTIVPFALFILNGVEIIQVNPQYFQRFRIWTQNFRAKTFVWPDFWPILNWQPRGRITFRSVDIKQTNFCMLFFSFASMTTLFFGCILSGCQWHCVQWNMRILKRDRWFLPSCHTNVICSIKKSFTSFFSLFSRNDSWLNLRIYIRLTLHDYEFALKCFGSFIDIFFAFSRFYVLTSVGWNSRTKINLRPFALDLDKVK